MLNFTILSETHWISEPVIYITVIAVVLSLIAFLKRSKTKLPDIINAGHEHNIKKFRKALHSKKCDINAIDISRFTPLILAINNFGQKYLIEEVLAKEPFLDWQDIGGNTALHYAVIRNKTPIIRLLLEKNANCKIENKEGKIPVNIAIENNKPDIVELLS